MWTVLLATSLASAQSATPERGDWAIGARASRWYGEETALGVGGHLRLTPWDRMGLELFWDSFARPEPLVDELWHAHVIGFHVLLPMGGNERTVVGPTFGACTSVEALTPMKRDAPGVADLRFAPHAGVYIDHALAERWTAGARATAYAYLGNAPHLDGWSAQTSNTLHVDPTLQINASVTRWF